MSHQKIQSALISVFHKEGLDQIVPLLVSNGITIYSTGGTFDYIQKLGATPIQVEDQTGYPSILDGRVKTLHPAIFGGILAKRNEDHLSQLKTYKIPQIDLVVVDLYPFEETVKSTADEDLIIEKIDIGGISLIRAAAKNYKDIVVIPSKNQYADLKAILENDATTELTTRKKLALKSFAISSQYDAAIHNYFDQGIEAPTSDLRLSFGTGSPLRYGENPHQQGIFFGELNNVFEKLNGKELSYNNLVDVDAAVNLMSEFEHSPPTFAVIKHTNACGLATRDNIFDAWKAALAGDSISAFGGILIANSKIDLATATDIDTLFYEILIAPEFDADALALLSKKKNRRLLQINNFSRQVKTYKSILNGIIEQDQDIKQESDADLITKTKKEPNAAEISDLLFANKIAKHIKSNTIVLVKNQQLVGMGSGQTSRIDACKQAILKAQNFGFDISEAVMASDAFFPFPDCVEIAHQSGITAVIQPGGSKNDQLSIDYCDANGLAMVFTGTRHFKH